MTRGFIICAGRQSRFKSDVPKALVNVNGKTLLSRNIQAMACCDEIYVVCSRENRDAFTEDKLGRAKKIVITSGFGSGDAVWQALREMPSGGDDNCFVLWGDSLQRARTFEFLLENYRGVSLIPCVMEDNPYVCVRDNGNGGVKVLFSKFGEGVSRGYHDLSVFCCDMADIRRNLDLFHDKIFGADGKYHHKHGDEMEFLDVFNETDIKARIVDMGNYEEFAFNTVEQLENLLKKSQI